jgi:hypothetical protein
MSSFLDEDNFAKDVLHQKDQQGKEQQIQEEKRPFPFTK